MFFFLHRYLEKAKTVIRSLDPNKNQANMTPHITKLKSDLAEKEKYIKQLEVKFVKHHSFFTPQLHESSRSRAL